LDFEGNLERILLSIKKAKEAQATLRVGPELEITGYGCLDHFLESDTFLHSWEMIARILKDPLCRDIILDIGERHCHRPPPSFSLYLSDSLHHIHYQTLLLTCAPGAPVMHRNVRVSCRGTAPFGFRNHAADLL
jgi:predicted amidohydrolase